MIDIKSRWKRVTDRQKWAARRASFVGKAKATQAVWFPPRPNQGVKKAASTAKKTTTKTTKKATKKSASAAKKTASGTKKSGGATKKATSSASKAATAAKNS